MCIVLSSFFSNVFYILLYSTLVLMNCCMEVCWKANQSIVRKRRRTFFIELVVPQLARHTFLEQYSLLIQLRTFDFFLQKIIFKSIFVKLNLNFDYLQFWTIRMLLLLKLKVQKIKLLFLLLLWLLSSNFFLIQEKETIRLKKSFFFCFDVSQLL